MERFAIPIWVAFGSAVGGLLRYWCSGLVARLVGETFPFGTLAVNVAGSLLIGVIASLTAPEGRMWFSPEVRFFLMVGVLGGFTTFSSFSLQTLNLIQDGEWMAAGFNAVGSVVLCFIGVWLGWMLGAALSR